MSKPFDSNSATEALSDLASKFYSVHNETGSDAHSIGLRAIPKEGVLVTSAYRSSGDGIQRWTYQSTELSDEIFNLWNAMNREWYCIFLVLITDTQEFVAEFLDPSEAEEDMFFPGDVEGEISQFLKIKNRNFTD